MVLGGAGAVAGFLTLASAAYACTNYYGDMTFTLGSGANQTVTAEGAGMKWCGGTPAFNLTESASTGQTISMTSAAATGCNASGANFLPNGNYWVGHAAGLMRQGGNPHINCHASNATILGTNLDVTGGAGVITSGGSGYAFGSNVGGGGAKGYDNICVFSGDSSPGAGDTAPNAAANDINIKIV